MCLSLILALFKTIILWLICNFMGQKLGIRSTGSYPINEWIINQLLVSKKVPCLANPDWVNGTEASAQQTSLGLVNFISKNPACWVERNTYTQSLYSVLAQCHVGHTLIKNLTQIQSGKRNFNLIVKQLVLETSNSPLWI